MEMSRRDVLGSGIVSLCVPKFEARVNQQFFVGYAPPVAGFDKDDNPISGCKVFVECWNKLQPGGLLVLPSVFNQDGVRLYDIKVFNAGEFIHPAEVRTIDGKECLVLPLKP